jgi:hypothetical protein
MSRYESGSERQRGMPTSHRAIQRWLIVFFCVMSISLAGGGYWYYRHETNAIRSGKYNELKAIAGLKVEQIVAWRNERMGDASIDRKSVV